MRVIALSLVICLLVMFIKQKNPDIGLLVSLGVVVVIGFFVFSLLQTILAFVKDLADIAGIDSGVITPLIKVVALALLSKLTADICRDAKETALASGIETASTVASLYLVLPLFSAVMQLLRSLL